MGSFNTGVLPSKMDELASLEWDVLAVQELSVSPSSVSSFRKQLRYLGISAVFSDLREGGGSCPGTTMESQKWNWGCLVSAKAMECPSGGLPASTGRRRVQGETQDCQRGGYQWNGPYIDAWGIC